MRTIQIRMRGDPVTDAAVDPGQGAFRAGADHVDYAPCRYPGSPIPFRGPACLPTGRYAVALGGSDTFGPHVEDPFPARVAEMTGLPVVNLGLRNAGPDVYLRDRGLAQVIAGAEICIVQVMGAANLSNPLYRVHPRRNDRFLRPRPPLERLFPDVDFTDFAFTRHLLLTLRATSTVRFARLVPQLETAWTARMADLLDALPGRRVALYLERAGARDALGPDPALVGPEMLHRLRDRIDHLVHLEVEDAAPSDAPEMAIPPAEAAAARLSLPPREHERVALAVSRALERGGRRKPAPRARAG
jgi:hypothetical protein